MGAIYSLETLKDVLAADQRKNGKPTFKNFISWNDNFRVQLLMFLLRKTEYHINSTGTYHRICKYIYSWLLRRQRVKTNIMLFPNTIGPGLHLVHPGYRRIDRFVKIGSNCTILPMVLFGRKRPTDTVSDIIVGDDCYISTGATILGPVTIGNNVTIGAGAVVTKDIPDNAVVGGVPAQIIRMKRITPPR